MFAWRAQILHGQHLSQWRSGRSHFNGVCKTKEGSKVCVFLSSFRKLVLLKPSSLTSSSPLQGQIPREECPPPLPQSHLPSTGWELSTTWHFGKCSLCHKKTYQLNAEILLPPSLWIYAWQDSDGPTKYRVTRSAAFCGRVLYNFSSLWNTQIKSDLLEKCCFVLLHFCTSKRLLKPAHSFSLPPPSRSKMKTEK